MEQSEVQKPVTPESAEPWTLQRILQWTTDHLKKHGIESARLESEILLAHARKCQRIELYTHFNEIVSDDVRAKMRDLVKRRVRHEPVAYLVGRKEFFSLNFAVGPGVFVPRPETETLVMEGLSALQEVKNPRILELCSGSGCISISLAKQRADARVTAVELHDAPFQATTHNAEKLKVADRMQVLQGSLFEPVPKEPFDLLVSNPPYVRKDEIPGLAPDIVHHEPHAALDGGEDGLDFVREILTQGPDYVRSGGVCLLEMDPAQMNDAITFAEQTGQWTDLRGINDLAGKPRFLFARRK
ncbi:peptide chain release factor N(5)-glutamine methyltransferase [Rubinisphaera margarita]|uniref:peptide chain release factor N(5)-glutamine methyltransferase n=1 Tax=Rubinisphaera margarita TaxID=2909586 RepID=UPI001EE85B66|nr:peptide chain release factor N(5)-glutamine methyltransferase [Rubinisphaera margarita]MCG6157215.1 peptide chain release factor N(5)-glutamine methyltransferase [Rubinisphaera margarita]